MRGERTQRLLDALLVANVYEHLVENAHLCLWMHRHVKPGLMHQHEQADGFQRHGFTAGVWPGDDDDARVAVHVQADRHGGFAMQERMIGARQVQRRVRQRAWRDGIHLDGELGLADGEIDDAELIHVALEGVIFTGTFLGEALEDLVDLMALILLKLVHLVVHRHELGRLHIDRRTAGGLVVNDTRHAALVLHLDRDNEAVAAHGDDLILQSVGEAAALRKLIHATADGLGHARQLLADATKLGGGAVEHVAVLANGAVDARTQIVVDDKGVTIFRHAHEVVAAFLGAEKGVEIFRSVEGALDVEKIAGFEHLMDAQLFQDIGEVADATEGNLLADGDHRNDLCSLLLPGDDLVAVIAGKAHGCAALTKVRAALGSEEIADLCKL